MRCSMAVTITSATYSKKFVDSMYSSCARSPWSCPPSADGEACVTLAAATVMVSSWSAIVAESSAMLWCVPAAGVRAGLIAAGW